MKKILCVMVVVFLACLMGVLSGCQITIEGLYSSGEATTSGDDINSPFTSIPANSQPSKDSMVNSSVDNSSIISVETSSIIDSIVNSSVDNSGIISVETSSIIDSIVNSSVDNSSTMSVQTSSIIDSSDDTTTNVPIVFINPVSGGYVITEYTEDGVVYNQTLGMYTGHMGLDIAGEENAKVFAVYDGEIESITSSYLTGTTITVRHSEELCTVYNSLEALEGLYVGQTVSAGDELGVISTNNRQEYKDGPHLHFEVRENGKNVNPRKYFNNELR